MSKRPHQEYDKSESEIEALVSKQLTAHPKKSESEVRAILYELIVKKVGKQMPEPISGYYQDYIDSAARTIEALYNQRMEKLLGENDDTAVSARMDTITYYKNIGRNKLRQEIRTRAGINKKEDV